MDTVLINNVKIYAENGVLQSGYIKIQEGFILEVGYTEQLHDKKGYNVIECEEGWIMVPGMIDLHIHGVCGADTMDSTPEALDIMTAALPKEGTTSFLAATMTEQPARIEDALLNTARYMKERNEAGKAEILGIHLEGPFINKKRAGAQPLHAIQKPNIPLFMKWQEISENTIKLVTLAPEEDQNYELTQYLKKNDIIVSAGHSDATYEQILQAIEKGISHVTHLFNQMSGLHHREPGIVGAAFHRSDLMVELIADGIHVNPEVVHIALNQITSNRMILITDSMRAKCLRDGQYDLGGQTVYVKNGMATLNNSTLAGSVLKMNDAFKNIQLFSNCTIRDALKMTSENPARELNCYHRKGSITTGKDADLVLLDKDLNVMMTICKGKIAYQKE
ncbi:MAG: N-acetylglucosamine-6-phosphate deacetylase [Bacillota bacterium]